MNGSEQKMELTHDQIADQIEDVADLYEERGDIGGGWAYDDLPITLCIEGAMQVVTGIMGAGSLPALVVCPVYRAVLKYVQEHGNRTDVLWQWHDSSATRGMADGKQYVLDTLRDAAKHERRLA
jgi:hypothetical protein